MTIHLLCFPECPNAEPALRLVEDVVSALGIQANIENHYIGSAEEAEMYRFLGSPTIQVDGADIERSRRSDQPNYGCRIYLSDGRQSGLPPRQMLFEAIQNASNSGQSAQSGSPR